MRRILLALAFVAAAICVANAQIWIMSPASQKPGRKGAAPSVSFRITNTGDFRVTNTGDSRIVAP